MNPDNPTNEQKDTLKAFLREEIDSLGTRLNAFKGKIKKEDFDSLEAVLNEKRITLESLEDDEDSQFFLLRREIGMLKDNAEALAVKRSWWSKMPAGLWIVIVLLPIIAYIAWLSFLQWNNQGNIYDYPATQTAVAAQTVMPSVTVMPTVTPTATP